MKRQTLQNIIRFLLAHLTRLEFVGAENIPPQGGVIITTNHLSLVDSAVLFLTPKRPEITALVTDKYKAYPFVRWFTETGGGIWIDRTKADFSAFREALTEIKAGRALGISPEGTRSLTGGLIEGKSGTVLLAQKSGVPIVPVGITGTEDVFKKFKRLQRPHVTAHYGPAFTLPPLGRENREQQLKEQTDEIMCRIGALIPERYRGVYVDHPRLKELLAEQNGKIETHEILA
jgi:1-acyl-sn-glycerol-3-phosphate acyltransferase